MRLLSGLKLATILLFLLFSTLAPAAEKPPGAGVYQQEVPEMGTLECAKCHESVFTTIRDEGGRHQLQCRECHVRFHSFQQGLTWEERMPSCQGCHGLTHGETFIDCLSCHRNAHAPVASMVEVERLANQCSSCHSEPQTTLSEQASAHTTLDCTECHDGSHGSIPACTDCHAEPHTPYRDNAGCVACHPAHAPLDITLENGVKNSLCQPCHGQAVEQVEQGTKQHAALSCVFCHAGQHGDIPSCEQCHGTGPHNTEMLKGFKGCNDCHGDAHTLSLQE